MRSAWRRGNPEAVDLVSSAEGIARVAAGAVLLVAGLAKLRIGPHGFAEAILGYRLLPTSLVGPFVLAIPALELIIGAALLAGVTVQLAAIAGMAVIATFSVAVVVALARGQHNPCGCGLAPSPVSRRLLLRNAALIVLLIGGFLSAQRPTFVWGAP